MTDTKKLVRKGKCNRCGECEGEGKCPHYDAVAKRCKVWRTPEQPALCRTFPNHPKTFSQHGSKCSYRFYDFETGREITKRKRRNFEGNWECDWEELDSYAPLEEDC